VTIATEVDHRLPKSQGGTDDDANLQSICSPCHKTKTATEKAGRHAAGAPDVGAGRGAPRKPAGGL
jgi:5-methylcytosine-specific restriction endonuclease McrA